MNNIYAIAIKEFIHIFRDQRLLLMIILMPIIQLLIYGYAINTDVKHLATVVYDQDQTSLSRRLVVAFEQSSYFDVKEQVSDVSLLYRALDRGKAKAGLLIPPDFTKDLLSGRGVPLQLLIDGTDSNPANVALSSSQAIVASFVQREGLVVPQISPVDFRPRLWYNPDLKSSYFMIPGLVGLVLQLFIPMITASAIVREKERGNIDQLLVTPIKPYQLILGKIIPYLCVGIILSFLILVASHFLFHVPVRGNPWTLFALTMLFLIVCLGIGLLASTIAENQQQASQIVMFFASPSILLSGFIFPRETMPVFVYWIGNFIPLTYFVKIIRGVTLKGIGLADLWDQVIPLAMMAVAIVWLSIARFQKRLS